MTGQGGGKPGGRAGVWRVAAFAAVVAAVVFGARAFGVGGHIEGLRAWIEGLGALGPAVFVLIYILAVVFALPGSVITLLAGTLFGAAVGVVVVSVGSTLGAGLAFLVSRYFARGPVSAWLAGNERFAKLDRLTERHGAMIVALTRLTPVFPFNILNYGFGLTGVRFWTYLFWSWLCMLPFTVVYVVFGDTLAEASKASGIPWPLVGTLLVSAVFAAVLVRYARRKLNEMG